MSEKKHHILIKEKLNSVIKRVSSQPELCAKNPGTDFTRNRKLPPERLISLIISIGGNSLHKEIFDFGQIHNLSVTPSAFVQQRAKLREDAFSTIFHSFNQVCDDTKTFRGYHLYAVDGSDLNIARNKNSESYVENFHDSDGYNLLHVNALFDVLNKTYKDCYIQPKQKSNEREAALEMIKNSNLSHHDIVIGDRGYPSYNFIEHLNRMGVPFLFRCKNHEYLFLRDLPLDEFDKDISIELRTSQTNQDKEAYASGRAAYIPGPSNNGKKKKTVCWDFESPFNFSVRVVRFQLSSGQYETLLTNLNRFEFSLKDLKELYNMRWGIETSFRELKYAIGLVNLHAKKEEFIIQEIYAKLIMYNFCERITNGIVINRGRKQGKKYDYQVNFTMAIHICINFFRHIKDPPPNLDELIGNCILPVRPGRTDQRKLIPKKYVSFLYRVA